MIDIDLVSKSYGKTQALDKVSITVADAAVTGLVGPNGAGKSTLLRIIANLAFPDCGSVSVDGQHLTDFARPGAALGVFLSAEWIPPHLTAESFLKYVCDLQGVPAAAVAEVLELVGLSDDGGRRVKTFSLGMRQRLGIGAAIVGRPKNYILDEPINGLDPMGSPGCVSS